MAARRRRATFHPWPPHPLSHETIAQAVHKAVDNAVRLPSPWGVELTRAEQYELAELAERCHDLGLALSASDLERLARQYVVPARPGGLHAVP